jgi:hypothetical protein
MPYELLPTIGQANSVFPVSVPTVIESVSVVSATAVEWSQVFSFHSWLIDSTQASHLASTDGFQ